jgi:fimbrial chaperone protein
MQRRLNLWSWISGSVAVATLLVAGLASSCAHAADLGIMPVAVQLDRTRDRATVQVINNGDQPVVLQAEAIAWIRESGVDRDGPTADLIVNPPVFTVKPGQTQIVRVGLRRNADAEKETTYRMVLREVPVPLSPEQQTVSGSVRVLVALRVPVYVAPVAVNRDERWQARVDRDGNLVASVTNAGNVHYKVASIKLHPGHVKDGDGSAPTAEKAIGAVLFPGEAQSFQLRPQSPLTRSAGAPMTLEIMTDRGPHYVPLQLADGGH